MKRKKLYCSSACERSFREDRRAGLSYPPFQMPNGVVLSWVEAAKKLALCPYCGVTPL